MTTVAETSKKYRDPIWALLYIAQLGLITGVAVVRCFRVDWSEIEWWSHDVTVVIGASAVAVVAGIAFSYAWLRFLCRPNVCGNIIKTAVVIKLVLFGVASVGFLIAGQWISSAVMMGAAVLIQIWYYFVRHRIAFTSVLMEMAAKSVRNHRSIIPVAIAAQIISFIWIGVWSMAVFSLSESERYSSLFAFLMLISLYWSINVLLSFIHVSAAGVAASWFLGNQEDDVVRSSVRRAGTTSFGSICLGSLILAVIDALRDMARSSNNDNAIVKMFAHCILLLLRTVTEFVTKYAYAYVAIWGQDFCEASRSTWDLLKKSGFDAFVSYDLSLLAVSLSSLIGGVIGALCSGLVGLACGPDDMKFVLLASSVIGGLLALVFAAEIMQVLTSCVTVFFVLWAESPTTLARNHPELHQKLVVVARKVRPDFAGRL